VFRDTAANRINWLTGISVFLVTLIVSPTTTLDPVNVPKMWMLTTLSFAMGLIVIINLKDALNNSNNRIALISTSVFVLMGIAMAFSSILFTQQFFGVYGRNTGLLTYLSFGLQFLSISITSNRKVIKPFLFGTVGALAGIFQANGADLFEWSNPYAPVIGTLGNPNFVAAFLGIGVAFALSHLLAPVINLKYRIGAALYIMIAIYDILKSDAQQGIIVSILSFGLVGYFVLEAKFSNPIIRFSYLSMGLIGAFIGIMGALQKGPLSSILYKPSVTYRGDYWQAGIEMFKNSPWFGVGLDAYGDYYRTERTLEATLRRGPTKVSNAAHNVFIDIAATAGIFALLAYLLVIYVGMRAAWRVSKRITGFDPFFVSVFVAWVGYLVQSVISINNIALGIWGWVLPGLLIAMDRWQTEVKPKVKEAKKGNDFTGMAMVAGLVIGGVIGYLPFSADANFRHALESGDPNKIYAAAKKWPTDAARFNYATRVFDANKMQDKAVELARETVRVSPRNFDAWSYLYNSPSVSGNEKREILDRLKELDPNNPELAKLG
jgi:O-antigen ligase